MRIRTWSLTAVIGLCLTLFPIATLATGTVNEVLSTVHQGTQITISGTSDLDEVIIKVYRPDHSILYFNIASVGNGAYSDTFTIGANEVAGTYEVKVGQAKEIYTTQVEVTNRAVVEAPTASPASGAVTSGTSVTLSSLTSGAAIYYTVDGSTPTTSSTLYTTPIVVNSGQTIKSISVHADMVTSGIMSESYTITSISSSDDDVIVLPAVPPIVNIITSTNGQLTLPVGKSGEVSLKNEITVSIPADATQKELKLTIERVLETQALLTDNDVLASPIYEILKNFSENFSTPIMITFAFDSSSLKENQRAAVFYYDELKKVWVEVEGGTVNDGQITVDVNHLTKYAVFAVDHIDEVLDKEIVNLSDISGHWSEASIKQAINEGIVIGYSDGTFMPNQTVSRAEFAVMLMNVLKPQGEAAELTFTDTAKIGTWAQQAVAQAVQAGIISGYEDGSFGPSVEVTRAELAVMVAIASGQPVEAAEATDFADDMDIPVWAKGSVASLKQAGIVQGKGSNDFAPLDHVTRAEAVTVVLELLKQ